MVCWACVHRTRGAVLLDKICSEVHHVCRRLADHSHALNVVPWRLRMINWDFLFSFFSIFFFMTKFVLTHPPTNINELRFQQLVPQATALAFSTTCQLRAQLKLFAGSQWWWKDVYDKVAQWNESVSWTIYVRCKTQDHGGRGGGGDWEIGWEKQRKRWTECVCVCVCVCVCARGKKTDLNSSRI